jgi:hypothetical protein
VEALPAGEAVAASCSDVDRSPQRPAGIDGDDEDEDEDEDDHSTSGGGMSAVGSTSRRSLSIAAVSVRRNEIRDDGGMENSDGRGSNPPATEEEEVQWPHHRYDSKSKDREAEVGWGDDALDNGGAAARSRSLAMEREDRRLR